MKALRRTLCGGTQRNCFFADKGPRNQLLLRGLSFGAEDQTRSGAFAPRRRLFLKKDVSDGCNLTFCYADDSC